MVRLHTPDELIVNCLETDLLLEKSPDYYELTPVAERCFESMLRWEENPTDLDFETIYLVAYGILGMRRAKALRTLRDHIRTAEPMSMWEPLGSIVFYMDARVSALEAFE